MSRARAARRPERGDLVATARARFTRVPARKARYVADLIRGLSVGEAADQLAHLHRPSACPMISNLLKSAVANAEGRRQRQEWEGDTDGLLIGEIFVDGGPMLKRFRAAPMGRAVPIRKRMSHATIKLYEEV
jgi:large subunit ribosomal protein L22